MIMQTDTLLLFIRLGYCVRDGWIEPNSVCI